MPRPTSLTAPRPAELAPLRAPVRTPTSQAAREARRNPVPSTPESIAAGKRAYDTNCAACHGNLAQGAVKAGVAISIIEEQGGKQAPDLTDAQWDHGSSDGEIYAVIKRGVPPTMMAGCGRPHFGQRHLEHRQLPADARGRRSEA